MKNVDVVFIGGRGFLSTYGGVENAIREISTQLAYDNVELVVAGVADPDNQFGYAKPTKVGLLQCPLWIYRFLGQHGMILYCVLKTLFFVRPKVAIVFASGPNIFVPVLKLFGIKVVSGLRAIDSDRDKWGIVSRTILRFGEYCAWRLADVFTVNSREMQSMYQAHRPDVVYLPNGARAAVSGDDDVLKSIGVMSNHYFLFAARLDPVKRLHLLLRAHAQMPADLRLPLVVAGGHSKSEDYQSKLEQYRGRDVIFLGHVTSNALEPLMRNCRAFVLPSVLEGMSNSLLTAMATGRPVLAANIPPNYDVVQTDDAVFAADDVTSLVAGLSRLAADKDFCLALGNALKRTAQQNHQWSKTAMTLQEHFADFLDRSREPRRVKNVDKI